MNLHLNNQLFIVCGASSGFGKAIAEALISEEASVIAVARRTDKLETLASLAPERVTIVAGDITDEETRQKTIAAIGGRQLHGALINAGGPPAKTVMETTAEDWDNAYRTLLRWKVAFTQALVPLMQPYGYGRLLFIESASVKQPLENLVLSNSLRVAVVGMVKTLSQEIARTGITANVIGPGSHNTPAIDRIYHKKSEQTGLPFEQIKTAAVNQIPVGALGEADDFASLALWLLSPASRYITGQTITVDGGVVRGTL
ncbi:SDR family oxidoreductase [Sediminibacterium soli]|uniref:SDR family oxidoreductase n=1 Tax=Sediminibacterium soli TaxID=2698829 RepID=UPI00137B351E|nr:SDR family oxidoreductase [Sediminibacterium soli]NCI48247.1 SDR family oxidoreductase [Sediminibacterium soli]